MKRVGSDFYIGDLEVETFLCTLFSKFVPMRCVNTTGWAMFVLRVICAED